MLVLLEYGEKMKHKTATKMDNVTSSLLGGERYKGITFTHQQIRQLEKFYNFNTGEADRFADKTVELEKRNYEKKYEKEIEESTISLFKREPRFPPKPDYDLIREESKNLSLAGTNRNVMRHTELDGLRLMGFLSKWLEPGNDPVSFVGRLMSDIGYDICIGDLWPDNETELEENEENFD